MREGGDQRQKIRQSNQNVIKGLYVIENAKYFPSLVAGKGGGESSFQLFSNSNQSTLSFGGGGQENYELVP